MERWIVSTTAAANEKTKHNEGLSSAIIFDKEKGKHEVLLVDLLVHDEKTLMGIYAKKWPLTKILDIGGKPVK